MLQDFRHARSGFARVLAALALVAIAVRVLVPGGYMLAPSKDESLVSVSLCSGREAMLDLSTGDWVDPGQPQRNNDDPNDQSDTPCVFAAAVHFATPELDTQTPTRLLATRDVPRRTLQIAPGRGLAAPPPWSTGPPSHALSLLSAEGNAAAP